MNLYQGKKGRELLLKGVKNLYDAVASTLGPGGMNVMFKPALGGPFTTKDGVTVAKWYNADVVEEDAGVIACKQAALKANQLAGDGPQPLYTKVLTPNGYVEMGQLQVGDLLCGTNGSIQKVTGIFPKGSKEIYKVKFFDGREVECCEDHLWRVSTHYNSTKVKTTKQLLDEQVIEITPNGYQLHKFYVPMDVPQMNTKSFKLSPYLVGLLLGDGSLSGTGSIELSLGPNDSYILDKISLPEGLYLKTTYVENKHYFRVKIQGKTTDGQTIFDLVNELGLLGTKSENKFIPTDYLYSDINSRLELLDGLIDTDGHINNRGRMEYSTVSSRLHKDILSLLWSLGKTTYSCLHQRKGDSYSDNPIYRIIELKGFKKGLPIKSITPTGVYTEMQCISVSNEDHLYFTENFVLTHNTTSSTVLAYHLLKEGISSIDKGVNPHLYKKGVNLALQAIIKQLEANAQPVKRDQRDLSKLATISSNDAELGNLIAEAFVAAGDQGFVAFDTKSTNQKCYLDIIEGMKFSGTYDSPLFLKDPGKKFITYEDALVFVIDRLITNPDDTLKFIENVLTPYAAQNQAFPPIVLFSRGVQGDALSTLIGNFRENNINIISVTPLSSGDAAKDMFMDIAAFSGAEYIPEYKCKNIGELNTQAIAGKVKKATISNEDCTLVGLESKETLDKYIKQITDLGSSLEVQERVSRLRSQIVTIQIGALMYSEVAEIRDRVEDAVNACRVALEDGMVRGAGMTLAVIAHKLKRQGTLIKLLEPDVAKGYLGLLSVCDSVLVKVLENSGVINSNSLKTKVLKKLNRPLVDLDFYEKNSHLTVDGLTGKPVDALDAGIVDPVKVIKTSLESAVSVANLYTMTNCLISQSIDN